MLLKTSNFNEFLIITSSSRSLATIMVHDTVDFTWIIEMKLCSVGKNSINKAEFEQAAAGLKAEPLFAKVKLVFFLLNEFILKWLKTIWKNVCMKNKIYFLSNKRNVSTIFNEIFITVHFIYISFQII